MLEIAHFFDKSGTKKLQAFKADLQKPCSFCVVFEKVQGKARHKNRLEAYSGVRWKEILSSGNTEIGLFQRRLFSCLIEIKL